MGCQSVKAKSNSDGNKLRMERRRKHLLELLPVSAQNDSTAICDKIRGSPSNRNSSTTLASLAKKEGNCCATDSTRTDVRNYYEIDSDSPLIAGVEGSVRKGNTRWLYSPIAKEKLSGNVVAIKTMQKCKDGMDHLIINTQVELLKKCNSPQIVSLYDVYEQNEIYSLVTEFAENGDLANYAIKNGKLSEWTAAYFIGQILLGLSYLHSTVHIVHAYSCLF